MSWRKRQLQRLGSWVVRQVSNTTVPDTTSGFRAYTREAALRMTIVSEFSYTLESIIQAGKKRMAIAHVPVATNPRTRESRLFDSLFSYIKRSSATIVRIYAMYEPLKVFTYIGLTRVRHRAWRGALRFLYYLQFVDRGTGHLQSLILSAVLMIVGFPGAADRPARRRHLRPTASCWRISSTACDRSSCRSAATRRCDHGANGAHGQRRRAPLGTLTIGRSVSRLDRHPGLQRGRGHRRRGRLAHRGRAPGARSSWSTTARRTTRQRARRGGRRQRSCATLQQGQRRGGQERHPRARPASTC